MSEQARPVLVVDDDPVVRGMIHQALEDEGLMVVTADDGSRALEEATRVRPWLVILDVSLPVLGGEAVAAALRQIMADDGVRIMAITADGRPAEKARALGAFAYLAKPFDIDELIEIVRRGLNQDQISAWPDPASR
jgi:DNA-binding response OmpR family regulator